MPCDDITEWVELKLNSKDRLNDYSVTKRTCGAEIGNQSFLLELFRGESLSDIMAMEPEALLGQVQVDNETDEFFALKHLFALQETLSSFVGRTSADPEATCSIAKVDFSEEETVIEATLSVVALTNKIKACGACGSCGKKKSIS